MNPLCLRNVSKNHQTGFNTTYSNPTDRFLGSFSNPSPSINDVATFRKVEQPIKVDKYYKEYKHYQIPVRKHRRRLPRTRAKVMLNRKNLSNKEKG